MTHDEWVTRMLVLFERHSPDLVRAMIGGMKREKLIVDKLREVLNLEIMLFPVEVRDLIVDRIVSNVEPTITALVGVSEVVLTEDEQKLRRHIFDKIQSFVLADLVKTGTPDEMHARASTLETLVGAYRRFIGG